MPGGNIWESQSVILLNSNSYPPVPAMQCWLAEGDAGMHAYTVPQGSRRGRKKNQLAMEEAKRSLLRFASQVFSDPEQRPSRERRSLVGPGAQAAAAAADGGLEVPVHDAAARALVPRRHVVLRLRHGAHHVRPALRRRRRRRRRPDVARRALECRGEPERRRAVRGRAARSGSRLGD